MGLAQTVPTRRTGSARWHESCKAERKFSFVIQHTTITCPTVDSDPITRYCFSMNTTIPLPMLSPDDVKRIMTDDEDLSDADPVADRAAFVAYLHADEDEDTAFANALAAVAHNMTVRWIADLNRRFPR